MKFRPIILSLIIFCSTFIMITSNGYALDISAGASAWYAVWDPAFTDFVKQPKQSGDTPGVMDINNSFMLGPMATLKIAPQVSLSTIFMYGSWYKADVNSLNPNQNSTLTQTYKFKKYDMDTTLSYSLNTFVKIFGGIKLQGYNYTLDVSTTINTSFVSMTIPLGNEKDKSRAAGPGLGIGFNYPIIDTLYISYQISGVYMYNKLNQINTTLNNDTPEHSYDMWGWNSTLGLAYYADSLNSTFSLGGRYQSLKYSKRYSSNYYDTANALPDPVSGKKDIFYGVTFAALYNFTI